ncbi:hypothetical protein ACOM2C_07780 [Pseudarthrobacter sp. So.54]
MTLARDVDPAELDLMILDMGSRELEPLESLPHTVAYVGTGAGAKEQQARFLRHLHTELERRRAEPGQHRRTVVLLDGLASLRDEFQDFEGQQLLALLYSAYADGPALGLSFAVSTTRAKAVPSAMNEVTLQKWLFRLADTYDYSSLGVRGKEIPAPLPGRCVDPRTSLQMHVATPGVGMAAAVGRVRQRWAHVPAKTAAIRRLPGKVTLPELGVGARLEGEPWLIPVGLCESDLSPAFLEIYEGEHALIAGPARSGKSTLLLALAAAVRGAATSRGPAQVWGICDRRSSLAAADLDRVAVGADEVPALLAALRLERGTVFLLIDDAERFEDADQSISGVVASGLAGAVCHRCRTGRGSPRPVQSLDQDAPQIPPGRASAAGCRLRRRTAGGCSSPQIARGADCWARLYRGRRTNGTHPVNEPRGLTPAGAPTRKSWPG